jgi:ABC-type multidrug transport system fused ATPase/permease subunit
MKAEDAAEMIDQESASDRFKQRAAVFIAVLAMLLAITGLGGANAGKEATNNNIYAANIYAFFQAKNIRQTEFNLAADTFELAFLNDSSLNEQAKAALKAKAENYRRTAARYESEPETQEGKKELLARAKEFEKKRDHALKQDPYFDYAEALLQIAIVLISVSIVATLPWLAFVGGGIGTIGTLLMINGYTLLAEIPFMS